MMKQRNLLFPLLLTGTFAAAPLAFAQDTQADTQYDTQTDTQTDTSTQQNPPQQTQTYGQDTMQATPATPATPPDQAYQGTSTAKKVSWSDLDTDKDGVLSKSEASALQSLGDVFDTADADHDGSLSADEYRSYLTAHGGGR